MIFFGMAVALVAAVVVWRQSRRSEQGLGRALGCLLAGGVILALLACVWAVVAVHTEWNLGLDVPSQQIGSSLAGQTSVANGEGSVAEDRCSMDVTAAGCGLGAVERRR